MMAVQRQDGATPQPPAHQQFQRQADEGWGGQHRQAPSTAPVRSRPYAAARQKSRTRWWNRIHWDRVPLTLFGFVILGLWWAAGGRWTIDGLPLLTNEILKFFHISARLAPLTDPRWYLLLCWLPLLISFAEHRYAPWRRLAWSIIMVFVIGVWLVVSGLDLGSTWMAVTHPSPDDLPIARQVAASMPLAAVWSIFTTFVPEVGMSVLWWWLWEPGHARL
jgi:hypothetical protein